MLRGVVCCLCARECVSVFVRHIYKLYNDKNIPFLQLYVCFTFSQLCPGSGSSSNSSCSKSSSSGSALCRSHCSSSLSIFFFISLDFSYFTGVIDLV